MSSAVVLISEDMEILDSSKKAIKMIHVLEKQANMWFKLRMSSFLLKKILRGDLLVLNSSLHMEKVCGAGGFVDLDVKVITRSNVCLFK